MLNGQLRAADALAVLGGREEQRKSLNATFEAAWDSLPGDLQATFAALALFNEEPSLDTAAAAAVLRVDEAEAGGGLHSWNLGLRFEGSDPAPAAALMAVCVAYEQEIGHPDAEADAQRVAEIRARAGKGD